MEVRLWSRTAGQYAKNDSWACSAASLFTDQTPEPKHTDSDRHGDLRNEVRPSAALTPAYLPDPSPYSNDVSGAQGALPVVEGATTFFSEPPVKPGGTAPYMALLPQRLLTHSLAPET